jgi:hypothetical protein
MGPAAPDRAESLAQQDVQWPWRVTGGGTPVPEATVIAEVAGSISYVLWCGLRSGDARVPVQFEELYDLNYKLVAVWAGYLDASGAARTSGQLTGLALRLFVELDPLAQRDAIHYLERLRNQSAHPRHGSDREDEA